MTTESLDERFNLLDEGYDVFDESFMLSKESRNIKVKINDICKENRKK